MDWNTVEAKPKVKKVKKEFTDGQSYHGRVAGGASLYSSSTGPATHHTGLKYKGHRNHAKELDADHFEEIKFETVSKTLSTSVKKARAEKSLTQGELAKLVQTKTSTIIAIENNAYSSIMSVTTLYSRIQNSLKRWPGEYSLE